MRMQHKNFSMSVKYVCEVGKNGVNKMAGKKVIDQEKKIYLKKRDFSLNRSV